MHIVKDIPSLRKHLDIGRRDGKSIAFVPTMGNLHEGHLSLIDEAKKHAEVIVASIFVNPMQFGENEDLDAYPRTFQADASALEDRGCHILFAPSVAEIYPNGTQEETRVDVPSLGKYHCGASREGHFIGVATVVSKLFNMVQPDFSIFGEKDFQQLAIIRKMTSDLCFATKIIGVATAREDNGLAKSSRNGYLKPNEKLLATNVYQTLLSCKDKILAGERDLETISSQANNELKALGFKPDYVNIANPATLKASNQDDTEFVILVAAYLGNTRLIDNITVSI